MRRLILLASVAAFLAALAITVRLDLPFMAVRGNSMEPGMQAGSLIWIGDLDPLDVEEGDVIVFDVHPIIQKEYDYTPSVVHRVIRVFGTDEDPRFRTQGDNNGGADPFTILPEHLRGSVDRQIPYLGIPFLFLQSDTGKAASYAALAVLFLFLYADEIGAGLAKTQQSALRPVIELNQQGFGSMQQALGELATATKEYGHHLRSHTSAIVSLSEASQQLKESASELRGSVRGGSGVGGGSSVDDEEAMMLLGLMIKDTELLGDGGERLSGSEAKMLLSSLIEGGKSNTANHR